MVGWLHYFEPEARLNFMVAGLCGEGGYIMADWKQNMKAQKIRSSVQRL